MTDYPKAKFGDEVLTGYATIIKREDHRNNWTATVFIGDIDTREFTEKKHVIFEGEFRCEGRKTCGKGKIIINNANIIAEDKKVLTHVIFEGAGTPELEEDIV